MTNAAIPTQAGAEDERNICASRFILIFTLLLCTVPVIGVVMPRALSFLPSLIGLIGFFGFWRLDGARPSLNASVFGVIGVVLVLAGLSALWAIDPNDAIERTGKIALVLLPSGLLLSVVIAHKQRLAPYFARYFLYAFSAALFVCLADHLSSGAVHSLLRGEFGSDGFNFSKLNRAVIVIVLCALPAFVVFRSKLLSRNDAIFAAVLVALFLALLSATDSQSAQLAVLVGTLVIAIFPVRHKVLWIVLWTLISALLFSAPWLSQYLFKTLPPLIGDIDWFKEGYALSRLEIWDFVSRYALQNPLYGYGIEATEAIKDFDTKQLYFTYPVVLHPHNFAIQFWIEFGVMGPIFLSALTGFLLCKIRQQGVARARYMLGGFLGVMAVMSTGYGVWQGWFLGLVAIMAVYIILASALLCEAEPAQ